MRALIALFVMVTAATVWAQSDQHASSFVLCKNKKSVRTLRVTGDKENCTTTYTRGGNDEVVGTNRRMSTCQSILDNVRQNLESSNWNCRDVSNAVVTTSTSVKQ